MVLSYFAGVISVFIWAILPVLVKSSFNELPISYFLVLRFFIPTIFLGILMWNLWSSIFKFRWSEHLIFSLILGLNYALQSMAIKDLPVSWYIVIFSMNPLLTLLFMKIRMDQNLIGSILLGLAGVSFFVIQDEQVWQGLSWKSFLYLFGGMLTWVFYTLRARSIQKNVSDAVITLYTQVISFVAMLVLWVLDSTPVVPFDNLSTMSWLAVIISGFGLPLAYYLYLFSLRRTPVFSQMSQYLELLFGLIFSWYLYAEELGAFKLTGAGLILLSLYFSSRIQRPQAVCVSVPT